MKIEQLIKAVNESVSNEAFADLARKEKELAATRAQTSTDPVDNTVPFPKQPGTAPSTTVAPQPTAPTQSKWDKAKQLGRQTVGVAKDVAAGAGNVSKGIQATAQGAGNLVKGVGQGVNTAGTGVASAIQGVGKVGAATTSALGSIAGGFKQGYQKQTGGGSAPANTTATPASQAANAAGNAELDQLKATIQTMDQRLRRAGI
jgi:hypothetical protein